MKPSTSSSSSINLKAYRSHSKSHQEVDLKQEPRRVSRAGGQRDSSVRPKGHVASRQSSEWDSLSITERRDPLNGGRGGGGGGGKQREVSVSLSCWCRWRWKPEPLSRQSPRNRQNRQNPALPPRSPLSAPAQREKNTSSVSETHLLRSFPH
ncbi:hypothetical protein AOLI_G00054360 [Acnodon oligacanthus]